MVTSINVSRRRAVGVGILSGYLLFVILCAKYMGFPIAEFNTTSEALVVLVCSSVNLISHLAVVLNLLEDGLVLSILVGVSFDVFSSTLYLQNLRTDNCFLWCWGLGDWIMHVRSLFLSRNIERLESVVTSAANNLKGDPGPFWTDHIFAYTDVAKHLLFFGLSSQACGWELVVPTVGIVWMVLSVGIYLSFRKDESSDHSSQKKQSVGAVLSIAKDSRSHEMICNCCSCKSQTSFSVYPKTCELWFCTFKELLSKIQKLKD